MHLSSPILPKRWMSIFRSAQLLPISKGTAEPCIVPNAVSEISILDVDLEFVSQTQLSEIYGF